MRTLFATTSSTVAVGLFLSTLAGIAGAQTAPEGRVVVSGETAVGDVVPTFEACYVPASGTIYRIDTPASPAPGAPKACLSQMHVKFVWNQQGVAGAKGDRGDKGDKGDPGTGGALGPDIDLPGTLKMGRTGTFDGGLLATAGTDLTLPSGSGSRFMWIPQKSAVRAGRVDGNEADILQIGQYTAAFGRGVRASGLASFAAGLNVTASGENSVAFGSAASTNGKSGSFVYGDASTTTVAAADATNQFLVRAAGGVRLRTASDLSKGCDVDGQGAIGCTGGLLASGNGSLTVPSGAGSRMMWIPQKSAFRAGAATGTQWDAANVGDASIALGSAAQASGANSIAIGQRVTASGAGSIAIGRDASTEGYEGAFVFADHAVGGTVLKATKPNQFVARASGGFSLRTSLSATDGCDVDNGTISCSQGLKGSMIERKTSEWYTIDASGDSQRRTLACSAGFLIMGGGVETDAFEDSDTVPGAIAGSYPDYGSNNWIAIIVNKGLETTKFRVYAICMRIK